MIKIMIISKNYNFAQQVINNMKNHDIDIVVSGIVDNLEKADELLQVQEVSLIFLEQGDLEKEAKAFSEKYKNKIIKTSTREIENEMKIMAIRDLNQTKTLDDVTKIRNKIIHELEYLGYNFKLNGSHYLTDIILQVYQNKKQIIDILERDIYPDIAKKYGKQMKNIKNSIANANKYMYCVCDIEKLKSYFNLCEDTKPNIKQVIFTVIQKVKMSLE